MKCFGLGDDDIAERGVTGHHACHGRIGQNRKVRDLRFAQAGECRAGFGQLHEAEDAFLHACTTRSGDDDHWNLLIDAALDGAGQLFASCRAEAGRHEAEVHHGDAHGDAAHLADARNDGVGFLGLGLVRFQLFWVGAGRVELKWVERADLGVHLFESALVKHRIDAVARFEREVVAAGRHYHQVFLEHTIINDLTSFRTFRPKILGDVLLFDGDCRVLGFSEECHSVGKVKRMKV